MTGRVSLILTIAAIAAGACMAGCETDDSLPTRPRTANPFAPDSNAQQNAEHRANEAPARDLPTGGPEFPGRSSAAPVAGRQVATLDVAPATAPAPVSTSLQPVQAEGFHGLRGIHAVGNTTGPTTVYNRDDITGPMPHIPQNPGTMPIPGSTQTPDGDWTIDNSWGQGLVLENYPHRPWPDSTAYYADGDIKNNPLYYFNFQEHVAMQQNSGTYAADVATTLIEVPWFFLNTAALPVLMVLEPPLAQRTTQRPSADPNFRGHLPADGPVVPSPAPGQLRWQYRFLNPDGTVKEPEMGNMGTTTAPDTNMPITPVTPAVPATTEPAK